MSSPRSRLVIIGTRRTRSYPMSLDTSTPPATTTLSQSPDTAINDASDAPRWAGAEFSEPTLARLRPWQASLRQRSDCDLPMLLTMQLSVFAWRMNTSIDERAGPAVPKLDSDALFSDKRGVLGHLLQDAIRVRRRIKVDRANSGITLHRERETQLLRDYTLGLQDWGLPWRTKRGAGSSQTALPTWLTGRLGHPAGGSALGARRTASPSCKQTTCTVGYDDSIEGVCDIGADVG